MDSVDQDRLLDEAMIETRRRWGWSQEQIDEFRGRRKEAEEDALLPLLPSALHLRLASL